MQSSFADAVRRVVAGIPAGTVATYGQVARLAGRPGAARAVGSVMRTNRDTQVVPCHRVVGADGSLTGYAFGQGVVTKRRKLEREGVAFSGDRVDLLRSGWETSC